MKPRTNNRIMTSLSSNSINVNELVSNKKKTKPSKKKQEELNKIQEAVVQLLNSAPVAIFIHENGICRYCNLEAIKILEEENVEEVIGKYLIDYFITEQRSIAIDRIKKTILGESFESKIYTFVSAKNNLVEVSIKSNPVIFNDRQCLYSVLTNISAEKKLEKEILRAKLAEQANKKLVTEIIYRQKIQQELFTQSNKLKAIFESGDQLMWTITKDLKITSFNKNYAAAIFDLYGYFPEVGKSIRSDKSLSSHKFWDEKYKLAFQGNKVEFISERNKADGEKVIRQMILYPIKDNDNTIIEVSGIGFNVTENKKNEEKLTQSLREKEVLLKEVHHRVKNNMQVISSILNIQSSYVKDVYALNLLQECQNRIKSMAFIHESLYQSENFDSVNFSEYISSLTKNLVHTYSIGSQKIKLVLTLDKLFLNLDLSIPCGLIINEIISNSIKYAFPNNRDGIIFVTLSTKQKKVTIEIGDNGIGLPKTIDIKNSETLGLQLVETLVDQINGKVKLSRNKGTVFKINFNI